MKVTLTPLLGARGPGPSCWLCVAGDARVIVDAGWSDALAGGQGPPQAPLDGGGDDATTTTPPAALAAALQAASTAHALVISHADGDHIGALPALAAALPPSAPILTTVPVHRLGQLVLYDAVRSRARAGLPPPPGCGRVEGGDIASVDAAFSRATALRYEQHYALDVDGGGGGDATAPRPPPVMLTAHAAGVTMGGATWELTTPGGASILLAPAVGHARERLLDAGALGAPRSRPALLCVGVPPPALAPPDPRPPPARDAWLVDTVLGWLRADGCVLIPVPTAGRALEVTLALDAAWAAGRYPYPLALASPVAFAVLEAARSQLEWAGASVASSFDAGRDNPLACRRVAPCHTLPEVGALPPGPKCVVASLDTLDAGISRDLFLAWCGDPRCAIVWPTPPPAGSLADAVLCARAAAAARAPAPHGPPPPIDVDVVVARHVPLTGAELEAWRAAHEAATVEAAAHAADGAPRVDGASGPRPHAPAEPDAPLPDPAPDAPTAAALDAATVASSDVLVDGFVPPPDAAAPMFPAEGGGWAGDAAPTREWDEYGALPAPGDILADTDVGGPPVRALGSGERGRGRGGRGRRGRGRSSLSTDAGDADDELAPLPSRPPTVVEAPTKLALAPARVSVRCGLAVGDGAGRADARALRNLIAAVAPRHLVLVGAPEATLAAVAAAAATDLPGGVVATPADGESADASPGAASFRVALSDAVLEAASLTACGGGAAAGWMDAVLEAPRSDGDPWRAVVPPPDTASDALPAAGALIGDVRLSDLRLALGAAGVRAVFAAGGGALVCGGRVVVRKPAATAAGAAEVTVEGPLCAEFYAVRDVLLAQFKHVGRVG